MTYYRLYFLDTASRIRHVVELDCGNDEDAKALVASHADGRAMELWNQDRLVQRYEPQTEG